MLETRAESPKQVLETHSFDTPGAPAFNTPSSQSPLCYLFDHKETHKNSHTCGPTRPCHTGCKQVRKYTLIRSADGLVRCINCFHAKKKKANYKLGKMMQIKVQDSCLLMPLCRMHWLLCCKFWWSLPEAKSCWNVYQYAVTWQTLRAKRCTWSREWVKY